MELERVDVLDATDIPVHVEPGPEESALPAPDEEAAREIGMIRAQQERFFGVVDALIALYRDFDKKRRADLKFLAQAMYEKLVTLGESVGVSRLSVDHLWRG
jgi:hypothetical protein